MLNSKLTELIGSLSAQELKKLDEYIKSPCNTHSKKLISLFGLMISYNHGSSLTKKLLCEKLYPGGKNSAQKVNLLLSDLFKITKTFLLNETLKSDKITESKLLLKALKKRGAKKNYIIELKDIIKKHKAKAPRDADYYYDQYLLETYYNRNQLEKIVFRQTDIYSEAINNADLFYMCIKLKNLIDTINIKREVNPALNTKTWLQDEVLARAGENLANLKIEHPLLYSYYLVLMTMLSGKNEFYYRELKKYVSSNLNNFTLSSLKELYNELKIYCIFKIGADFSSKYLSELLELYKFSEKYFYSAEKSIRHADFNGAIIIALNMNNISYAEYIYEKYNNKIDLEPVEDTLYLTKAMIQFSKGEFDNALINIKHVNYNNFNYYIRIKVLLLEIYYETKQPDAIHYETDSLKHYLSRHKANLIKYYKPVTEFMKYLNRLMKAAGSRSGIKVLQKDLSGNKEVFSKKWLIEKASELNK
jgi:hypothetical protein